MQGSSMPTDRNSLLMWGAIAVVVAAAVAWVFARPGSYEECMLTEMRGQNKFMYGTVEKLCARRFRREVEVYGKPDFTWTFDGLVVRVELIGPPDEYIYTRALFRF